MKKLHFLAIGLALMLTLIVVSSSQDAIAAMDTQNQLTAYTAQVNEPNTFDVNAKTAESYAFALQPAEVTGVGPSRTAPAFMNENTRNFAKKPATTEYPTENSFFCQSQAYNHHPAKMTIENVPAAQVLGAMTMSESKVVAFPAHVVLSQGSQEKLGKAAGAQAKKNYFAKMQGGNRVP